MTNEPRRTGRREFLRSAARWGVLGAMGWFCAHLAGRALNNPEACEDRDVCGRCGLVGKCALPRAIRHRAEQKEQLRG